MEIKQVFKKALKEANPAVSPSVAAALEQLLRAVDSEVSETNGKTR